MSRGAGLRTVRRDVAPENREDEMRLLPAVVLVFSITQ